MSPAGTHVLSYGPMKMNDDEEDLDLSEEDLRRRGDPCYHYTILDQAWRATNATTKFKVCDRHSKWKGSYGFSIWTCLTLNNDDKCDYFFFVFYHRLVPPLLQRHESADAREVCPCGQMRHPLPAVAGGASPEDEGRHRHPPGVWPLEEELLRFQVHPHPGQEVQGQLLRLQVHSAVSLLFGLLCRYYMTVVSQIAHFFSAIYQ